MSVVSGSANGFLGAVDLHGVVVGPAGEELLVDKCFAYATVVFGIHPQGDIAIFLFGASAQQHGAAHHGCHGQPQQAALFMYVLYSFHRLIVDGL